MLRYKQKKSNDLKPVYKNIFRGKNNKDLNITDHFLERWNERISEELFNSKEELEEYILSIYKPSEVEHLYKDHYLICGNIYVTAALEENGIVLITTLGTYEDNPVLYNVITTGQLKNTIKKYGKLNLCH